MVFRPEDSSLDVLLLQMGKSKFKIGDEVIQVRPPSERKYDTGDRVVTISNIWWDGSLDFMGLPISGYDDRRYTLAYVDGEE